MPQPTFQRRQILKGMLAASAAPLLFPGVSRSASSKQVTLNIGSQPVNFTGKSATALTINGSLPAPTLRWQEGDDVRITVRNQLDEMSAIHWHGLILPSEMDGVPGLSFPGIAAGQQFEYQFRLKQSGTYWYHSHANFQEQQGIYGAIIIDPAQPELTRYDREHVVLLSDWSDENPETIYRTLKKNAHVYNRNRRTFSDVLQDVKRHGIKGTIEDRAMWNDMRMLATDLADVSGYTYQYLMNGQTSQDGWWGKFEPGETIRLRFINAAAMSIFDIRVPGIEMTVIAADGQPIEPVTIEEFRLAPAETLDVLVTLRNKEAYTIFAQSIDRSGYAIGALAPSAGLDMEVPKMDPVPLLQHIDMGMATHMPSASKPGDWHQTNQDKTGHHAHNHHHGIMVERLEHPPEEYGPHVDMRAEQVNYRLDDPGVGLRNNGRRVLTYADFMRRGPSMSMREPDEEWVFHLTGNMSRYMWSINGVTYADAEPVHWQYGKRYRITLINDTMMNHPIHLHGLWSELETGDDRHLPAKHTVVVQPGAKISYRVTADARGRWAYHCHMLYHMMGMFREVRVS